MPTVSIKDLDGLPKGEIELLVERSARAVGDEARGAREAMMTVLGARMDKLDSRLTTVEARLANVESLAQQGLSVGQESVSQGKEILARFEELNGEMHEVKEETAEGVKITTKFTRWGATAKDLHLDRLGKWLLGLISLWGATKLVGWLFGPEIRDAILHRLF